MIQKLFIAPMHPLIPRKSDEFSFQMQSPSMTRLSIGNHQSSKYGCQLGNLLFEGVDSTADIHFFLLL